jgi:hypothetical protein
MDVKSSHHGSSPHGYKFRFLIFLKVDVGHSSTAFLSKQIHTPITKMHLKMFKTKSWLYILIFYVLRTKNIFLLPV